MFPPTKLTCNKEIMKICQYYFFNGGHGVEDSVSKAPVRVYGKHALHQLRIDCLDEMVEEMTFLKKALAADAAYQSVRHSCQIGNR